MRALPLGRRRIASRSLSFPFLFGAALVLGAFFSLLYLTQASTVATTGYDIKRLETEKAHWQIRNEQLRLTVGQLRSLDRVEREAAAHLNMGPPAKLMFVSVDTPPPADSTASASSSPSSKQTARGANFMGWWEEFTELLQP